MTQRIIIPLALLFAAACAGAPPPASQPPALPLAPYAEYHAHLLSPATAAMASDPQRAEVAVPAEVAAVLRAMERGWNDSTALAAILSPDAMVLNRDNRELPGWILGRDSAAEYLAHRFARAYRITPVAFHAQGAAAQVSAYLTRGDGAAARHFGQVLLSMDRGADGGWRVSAAAHSFPGPVVRDSLTAANVVAQLDSAGIRRGVLLSVAYWYGDPFQPAPADEYAKVRAENDWVAAQAARYPDRLVAFCSFNPLRDYALAELERCSRNPAVRGIKLHLGNSGVDVRKPDDAERVRQVFQAANALHLALVVHMWTDPSYEADGRAYAQVVLDQLLPAAPDVTVQIAHMAGGGRSTDAALAVFADAIAAGDPRTRNLYFDVATLTAGESAQGLQKDAGRMRQIGMSRILFGSDMSPPNPSPRVSWATFRTLMPLTDAELRTIAGNVAPYLRPDAAAAARR